MKIYIPQNYFAGMWAMMLNENHKQNLIVSQASLMTQEIANAENEDLFLIPSLSILKNKDLFISKDFGIAFDGILSNSYLYLRQDLQQFDSVLLRGDVSMNEILLSKILFLEKYDSDIEIKLDTSVKVDSENNDYLLVGNENIDMDFINNGISFADQVTSLLNFPYVDFILTSKSEESIKEFRSAYKGMDRKFEDEIDSLLMKLKLNEEISELIKMNLNSVYFELTDNEIEGFTDMLRLPFYHGMVEEITELRFV